MAKGSLSQFSPIPIEHHTKNLDKSRSNWLQSSCTMQANSPRENSKSHHIWGTVVGGPKETAKETVKDSWWVSMEPWELITYERTLKLGTPVHHGTKSYYTWETGMPLFPKEAVNQFEIEFWYCTNSALPCASDLFLWLLSQIH